MALSIIQVIIIGVVIYLSNSKILIDSEKEHLDQLINTVNQDLESRIDAFNADALNIVIRNEIKQNLNLDSDLLIGIAKREIVDYLNSRTISTKGYLDISIIDMNSNTYSVRATYYLPPNFDISETEAYKEAAKYNGGLVWLSENDLNMNYAKDTIMLRPLGGISGVAVIKDYVSNEVDGLLVLVLEDKYFRNMEYSNEQLENVLFYLVSPDKSVIIPMNSPDSELDEDIINRIGSTGKRDAFTAEKTDERDEYLVSYIKNEAMGWYLVSISTASDLTATFHQTISILLTTLVFSLLACFFIASRISGYVTKGLKALAEKMRRVGEGDFDIRINTRRYDEVGELANVFDVMMENTNKLIKQKYEQELLTKDAEFRALQAQINPHFLYNTLDMINWRLIEIGEEEVSQSIVALGNLLRYSTESKYSSVDLEDEIDNIKDYLYLRHSNSKNVFEYEVKVEEAQGVMLPKLTLQPIVENAIVHGFADRKRGNVVDIYGTLEKDRYIISVVDNGVGMTEKQVLNIKKLEPVSYEGQSHIGLKNVEERIKYMYEDAEFIVVSKFGHGTTIKIIIPYIRKE